MSKKTVMNTPVFRYYNCNAKHVRTDDCVIRAISSGTGDSWENIAKALFQQMLNTGYIMNSPECYGEYLKKQGWVQQKQVIKKDGKKVRLSELAQKTKCHIILHTGSGHVSYISDNHVWDIWDCTEQVAGICWVPADEVTDFNKIRKEF